MTDVMQKAMESAGAPEGAKFDNASVTAKYSDWGTDVNIEAPPASETSDAELPG